MSALNIYERAPVGAIVSWKDGKPQPLPSETAAIAAWWVPNGTGRLVGKTSRFVMGQSRQPVDVSVMLEPRGCDDGSGEPGFIRFPVENDLHFAIVECPPVGSCRIFSGSDEHAEMLHLASSRAHAQVWINNLGFRHVVMSEVTADEIAADVVEGRAAA